MTVGRRQPGRRAAPRAQGQGDDCADASRESVGIRPGRDAAGRIGQRFLEKPKPDEVTCDTINAGIYVLEPDTFDRIPKDVAYSIERGYFPSLVERGEPFFAYVDRGYWIDIGTPEKYVASAPRHVRRPLCRRHVRRRRSHQPIVAPDARIEDGAHARSAVLHRQRRADQGRRRDRSLLGDRPRRRRRGRSAMSARSIIWPNTRIGQHADRRRRDHRRAIAMSAAT